jgi:hypothetical protein
MPNFRISYQAASANPGWHVVSRLSAWKEEVIGWVMKIRHDVTETYTPPFLTP